MPIASRRAQPPKLSEIGPEIQRRQVFVPKDLGGERLDKAAAALAEGVSRTLARKIISQGGLFLGRERCKVASRKVFEGDCLTLTWHPKVSTAQRVPLVVVHKGEDFVVLNKPAGQHVQGTAQGDAGTLIHELKHVFGHAAELAHRLDAAASGLVLAGLSSAAVKTLMESFKEDTIHRSYLALTESVPHEGECRIPLAREGRRMRPAAPDEDGAKPAHSVIEVLGTEEGRSLVRVRLHTGRMHQVRVHLSALGAPIVGDRLYGGSSASRLCLHAALLRFEGGKHSGLKLQVEPPESFLAEYGARNTLREITTLVAPD